jgi:putative transcriptional regulator
MATKTKFKSDAFEAIHSSATALRGVGAIDEDSLREFDAICLAEPASSDPTHRETLRVKTAG